MKKIVQLRWALSALLSALVLNCGVQLTTSNPASASGTLTWNAASSITGHQWTAVAYGNGKFVAVGENGGSATSTDGITWTVNAAVSGYPNFYSVTFGGEKFVADSDTDVTYTSTNGVSWTQGSSIPTFPTFRSMAYGNATYVGVSSSGIFKSTDGLSWTSDTLPAYVYGAYSFFQVAYGNGIFMVVGRGGDILISTDGTTWTAETDANAGTAYWPAPWEGVSYANNVWVIGNAYGLSAYSNNNGATWNATTWHDPLGRGTGVAASDGSAYVIVNSGMNYSEYSTTCGTSFESAPDHVSTFNGNNAGSAYGNNTFVIVAGTIDYAQWTPPTTLSCPLTYYKGSNPSVSPPTSKLSSSIATGSALGSALDGTGAGMRLSGYVFVGWCKVDPGLSPTTCASGNMVSSTSTMPGGGETLYPYWATAHNVTYAPGTGSGSVPSQSAEGTGGTFSVAANSLTNPGFNFAGWFDGASTYQPGSTYTVGTSDVTLTALWTAQVPPIVYSKPTAPSGVAVTMSSGNALVSFSPGSSGNLPTYDQIDMYINGQLFGNVCNVSGVSSCPISNLGPDVTFSFTVTAINSKGSAVSALSNSVSYTSPSFALPTTTTTTVPPVMKTITCLKGAITKKVTALNPVCPAGYKKK